MANQQMIASVKGDMQEKYQTYKYMMGKYRKAKDNEFYFEGMLIVYAMMEDRLRSFIYHAGFFADREVRTLDNKRLKKFPRTILDTYMGIEQDKRINVDNISCKTDIVRALLKWANDANAAPVGPYQTELKKQLKKVDYQGTTECFDDLAKWLSYRNEVIHSLMNKKKQNVSDTIAEELETGYRLARFIDSQVRKLDKNDSIRSLRFVKAKKAKKS